MIDGMKSGTLLLTAFLLLLPWSVPAMAIEEPAFKLVLRDGDFELRDYSPYLLAETRVEAPFEDAGNIAFGRLFRYISGRNDASRKISMTAPVRQDPADTGAQRVAFVVPAQFTRDTVPRPSDPQVVIREEPARRLAVLRYSGRWTEQRFREHEGTLREWMGTRGLVATGPAIYARYNAPFIPWPMRRNEVLIPVDGGPAAR
jgi:SOUL heme-binding protein